MEDKKQIPAIDRLKSLTEATSFINQLGFQNIEINGDVITLHLLNPDEFKIENLIEMDKPVSVLGYSCRLEHLENLEFAFVIYGHKFLVKRIKGKG